MYNYIHTGCRIAANAKKPALSYHRGFLWESTEDWIKGQHAQFAKSWRAHPCQPYKAPLHPPQCIKSLR